MLNIYGALESYLQTDDIATESLSNVQKVAIGAGALIGTILLSSLPLAKKINQIKEAKNKAKAEIKEKVKIANAEDIDVKNAAVIEQLKEREASAITKEMISRKKEYEAVFNCIKYTTLYTNELPGWEWIYKKPDITALENLFPNFVDCIDSSADFYIPFAKYDIFTWAKYFNKNTRSDYNEWTDDYEKILDVLKDQLSRNTNWKHFRGIDSLGDWDIGSWSIKFGPSDEMLELGKKYGYTF